MITYMCLMTDFREWLQNELNSRGWAQIELTRRGGISSGAISKLMSGERKPGPDMCNAIATALNLPPEDVFRAAGLLPQSRDDDPLVREAAYLVGLLSQERKRQVLEYIRFVAQSETSSGKQGKK